MRCFALADAIVRRGGQASFVCAAITPALAQKLAVSHIGERRSCGTVGTAEDAAHLGEVATQSAADWIVVDGYCFGAAYQRLLKSRGFRLLVIDDLGDADAYFADYILNQNIGANRQSYPVDDVKTRHLLGLRYALLRREFRACWGQIKSIAEVACHVLVTLGGSDPGNVTAKVLDALEPLVGLHAVVVVGPTNPHLAALNAHPTVRTGHAQLVIDPPDMSQLMAAADLAVAATGTTCWELCVMGLPTIGLVIADNQAANAKLLGRSGVIKVAGLTGSLDTEKLRSAMLTLSQDATTRRMMSRRSQELIDGFGVDRVIARLGAVAIRLRRATSHDAGMIWEWANDPEVRQASFSTESIPWEKHLAWFSGRLADPRCCFYIAEDAVRGTPLGQIRFEVDAKTAIVSVSLPSAARGRGWGPSIIRTAGESFFAESTTTDMILAYVRPDNAGSLAAFAKADYEGPRDGEVSGNAAKVFTLSRSSL
jgi:UDP-2,4-diacetamido-2,4,6-trideoxy-beta-L-altropyranose hydrolase